MSTEQHESLKQAEWLEVYALTPRDREVAAMLRASHALIVQMAEALAAALEGNEYRCIQDDWAWHRKQMPSNAALDKARESHAAATQYLKGPKT